LGDLETSRNNLSFDFAQDLEVLEGLVAMWDVGGLRGSKQNDLKEGIISP
jgi:hypothetical protein